MDSPGYLSGSRAVVADGTDAPHMSIQSDLGIRRRAALTLSHEGGQYPANTLLRDKLCLLDDGQLHLRKGTRLDPDVMAYIQRLEMAEFRYTEHDTDLAGLRQLYGSATSTAGPRGAGAGSDRQKEIVALIQQAVRLDASDLYIVTHDDKGFIRARINGLVQTLDTIPASDSLELSTSLYASMCDQSEQVFQVHKPQDARLKSAFLGPAGLYGARVSTMPRSPGHSLVMRLLYNSSNRPKSLGAMGYLPEQAGFFQRLTDSKTGVYIFSGPTGSGKSTSLQVCCEELMSKANNQAHGITLEDPTEYEIQGWTQVPCPRGADLRADWITGIRHMMRHDPDYSMIGEMRDRESMEAVMELCLTGHLSLTTVHANDAVACLQRIKNKGVSRDLFADPGLIRGLVNQKLVPVLCEHCRIPWAQIEASVPQLQRDRINRHCQTKAVFVKGPGCSRCKGGVTGRLVIAECVETSTRNLAVFADEGRVAARRFMKHEQNFITRTESLIRAINDGRVCPLVGEHHVNPLDEDKELHDGIA
ncbi:GspE/PulE family protein [Stenotrophomonas maltophilia]|uniref:GspE/PulE family protein n=1 Tax=Stenotrophomonas maltophilia TaxID=40324 RepID=UPI00066C7E4F|nr:ATPase, T2SS/T4P/T4SS family [Stenotrophomonas maltophilia]